MLGPPSFPAANSQQRQGGRKKEPLKKGHSMMDWIRYANSRRDIQGFGGRTRPVTQQELAQHVTEVDAWTALHGSPSPRPFSTTTQGKVYNITQYIDFHPGGGVQIMEGAGKDATQLFNQVHKWVNFESVLAKCYIGPLIAEIRPASANKKTDRKSSDQEKPVNGFLVPSDKLPPASPDPKPRYEWYQTSSEVIISIFTRKKEIDKRDVLVDCANGRRLNVKLVFEKKFFQINLDLERSIKNVKFRIINPKKVDITLAKKESEFTWKTLGLAKEGHNALYDNNERDLTFRECLIVSVQMVTHNTKLFGLALPPNVLFYCPVGHHVILKDEIEGMEVTRSFTTVLPSFDEEVVDAHSEQIFIMVKSYPDGTLSPKLLQKLEGHCFTMSDSVGNFDKKWLAETNEICMIGAGTGFTPLVSLIYHFLITRKDHCTVKLLFANRQERDILWKEELDALMAKLPHKFFVAYVLSKPPADWKGFSGRISENVLENFYCHNPFSSSALVETAIVKQPTKRMLAVCGPDEFTKSVQKLSYDFEWTEEEMHCFMS